MSYKPIPDDIQTETPTSLPSKFHLVIVPVLILVEMAILALSVWNLTALLVDVPASYVDFLSGQYQSGILFTSEVALWSALVVLVLAGNVCAILWLIGRKSSITFSMSISLIFFLLGGTSIGFQVALNQIDAQVELLQTQQLAAVANALHAYDSAAQTCSQIVLSNHASYTLQPCTSCDFIPTDSQNFGLDSTILDSEDWDAEPIYWTQLIEVDQIICEDSFSAIGPQIWGLVLENSVSMNESTQFGAWPCDPVQPILRPGDQFWYPGGFTVWLDEGGIQKFLLGIYQYALGLFAPLELKVTSLPTSDCVLLTGFASTRFPLTNICGQGSGQPSPANRITISPEFARCASPQLLAYQIEYTAQLAQLNNSIYELPPIPERFILFTKVDYSFYTISGILTSLFFGPLILIYISFRKCKA